MRRTLTTSMASAALGLLLIAAPLAQATVIDRVAAVVNNQAIALSELNSAWVGSRGLPGAPASREALLTHMVELSLQRQRAEALGMSASQADIDQAVLGIMMIVEGLLQHAPITAGRNKQRQPLHNHQETKTHNQIGKLHTNYP